MSSASEVTSEKIATLTEWLRERGGYLHPSVQLSYSPQDGLHMRATADIPATHIISVPHSLTLSCLNAMVDDAHPVFRDHSDLFPVESLGFFYLVTQWITIDVSYWKQYIDLLPRPEDNLNTPFWFEEEDLRWLGGSDVLYAFTEREKVWREYWRDGLEVLRRYGVDIAPYTWTLFKWAATVFSSRSFGSRALCPESTSLWRTFRTYGTEAVCVELSDQSPERRDFPVLFPIMDAMNHSPQAKVDWNFAADQFTLTSCEVTRCGDQLYNNYGPKSNTELLMGYGFCDETNPYDCIIEALKAPPLPLQTMLRSTHPDCFDSNGDWKPEAATFQLFPPDTDLENPFRCWTGIPHTLLELFYYIILFERGLDVRPIRDAQHYLLNREGRRYLPRIAFYIVTSLLPKIDKLSEVNKLLPDSTQNIRQESAKTYRNGQSRIMRAIRDSLGHFLRTLRPQHLVDTAFHHPALWTLPEILHVCQTDAPRMYAQFMAGIGHTFSVAMDSDDPLKGIEGDDEQVVWLLWTCHTYLFYRQWMSNYSNQSEVTSPLVIKYMHNLELEFGEPVSADRLTTRHKHGSVDSATASAVDPQASRFLGFAQTAAQHDPDSLWASKAWSSDFVLDWGLRIVNCEGMLMKLADDHVRYVVYLHTDEEDNMA